MAEHQHSMVGSGHIGQGHIVQRGKNGRGRDKLYPIENKKKRFELHEGGKWRGSELKIQINVLGYNRYSVCGKGTSSD